MKISILGAGNGGTTVSADLARKGHEITLCKTSNSTLHDKNFQQLQRTKSVKVYDLEETYDVKLANVTRNLEEAITDADLIILYIQTNYHENLVKRMAPFLKEGQTILFEPGALSTCYVLKHVDTDVTVIEAESSPIDCRIEEPGVVRILFKNVLNPFGVYPIDDSQKADEIIKQLGYGYRLLDSVVEAALHNPNIIVHTVGSIFSIPRIEFSKGEYWMYKEVFTPHIWNIVEALDNEKIQILKKLNFKPVPYIEACQERNFINDTRTAKEAFFDYAYNHSPKGPDVPNSRYITEDVSQGLVLVESLGKMLNVKTPISTSLINCASAALKTDFRMYGRTIENLGEENLMTIFSEIK
ncbi:MAG: NAD/NADP octopine/nopaline dehydrogenase family protein [Saccharofermentanales bacterium]|mgnify:CR=1 FL=1|jgi:opine dehydrogenase|nr:NAD/NADP octopine/nopaline dehydrogenase family protein [Bacillota bacterium]